MTNESIKALDCRCHVMLPTSMLKQCIKTFSKSVSKLFINVYNALRFVILISLLENQRT